MLEEDTPRPATAQAPLDRMGVEDLRAYIAGLQAEIARAEAEILRKTGFRSAAESVFRKP